MPFLKHRNHIWGIAHDHEPGVEVQNPGTIAGELDMVVVVSGSSARSS